MTSLKVLFKPYQPSIDHLSESLVQYEESSPHTDLQDYIYCYWRLHTSRKLDSPFMYRVVSDGCIDILYEQQDPQKPFITGFSTKFIEFELGRSFDYIGVRFLPTGFPAMFDIPADSVANNFIQLEKISSALSATISETIIERLDLTQATRQFDQLFLSVLLEREITEVDKRLMNAILQILQSRGRISMNELDVGVSDRQLRRLFEYYFGESPKTFAKVIRFQNILGAKPSAQSLKNNKIFYDEGYYDQAHFIREFKAFYGVTPSKAFGR